MKNQSVFVSYLKLLRVTSWLKNVFVFVPVVFAKHFFDKEYLSETILAFAAFCIASSMVYVFNDLIDLEKDKIHPVKKDRPLASGIISKRDAIVLISLLLGITILFSLRFEKSFVIVLWIYIVMNFFYTIWLKEIVIVDIFCIAFGFMLRVFSGAFAINVFISNWLILTTIFISLFLAVMKRRVEIAGNPKAMEQRAVLKDYTLNFIDQISSITAGGVIICYALYSVSERTVSEYGGESLVFSTLFVIFGIFRYMFLVYKKEVGENVAEALIKDIPMMINVLLFLATTIYIIYY
jgi:4-hydroxybenzoate polyprenyltransferase